MKVVNHQNIDDYKSYIPDLSDVYVFIDTNLKPYFTHFADYNIIEIEATEEEKTISTVEKLTQILLDKGADRNCFILGVGGGITTDVIGFTASIYKRGVKFGFIPTTLLAQVDASIGGKNGVNFLNYKNILGVINQPEFIFVCPEFLKTLPLNAIKSGVAEIIKTFILFDAKMYDVAVKYFAQVNSEGSLHDMAQLEEIIAQCAKYKQAVVFRDEFERGERRLLNLGHTFGHAIEKHSKGKANISHGEAVSIGMVLAARLAGGNFASKLKTDLESMGLPTEIPTYLNMQQLIEAVSKDKKVFGSEINFILPYGLENTEDKRIQLKELEALANELC